MFQIYAIIIKNFQNMFKSKFSLGLVILGPLALVALLSFGVSGNGLSNIEASFFSLESGELRQAFIQELIKRDFIVNESVSKEDCIKEVINGNKEVCIILKEDEEGMPLPNELDDRNIKNFKKGFGVEVQVDFSKQRVVWGIINRVEWVVDGFSKMIQQTIMEEISQKFDSSLAQIEILESNLEYVDNQVRSNKNKIESLKNDLSEFKRQSTEDLNGIRNSLNQIYPLLLMGQNTPQIIEINRYLSDLEILITSTTEQSNSISSIDNSLNQILNNLDLVRQKVVKTKLDLSDLRKMLSDEGEFNLNKFVDPIPFYYSSVTEEGVSGSGELNLADYILPSSISFFLIFVSLMFSSSLVIKERSSNAHIRNYLSKSYGVNFVIGNLIYLVLIVLFQISILLTIADFTIIQTISDNWLSLSVFLFLGVLIFSTIGMILGYIFNTRDTVILSAVCIALVFIIFSPLINPIETMPSFLKSVFSNSPAIIVEQGVSRAIFFNKGVSGNYEPLTKLSSMFIFLLIISFVLHKLSKERIIKE